MGATATPVVGTKSTWSGAADEFPHQWQLLMGGGVAAIDVGTSRWTSAPTRSSILAGAPGNRLPPKPLSSAFIGEFTAKDRLRSKATQVPANWRTGSCLCKPPPHNRCSDLFVMWIKTILLKYLGRILPK